MLNQVGAKNIKVKYMDNGRIPGSSLDWKKLFPFLGGKRFSDNYLIHANF